MGRRRGYILKTAKGVERVLVVQGWLDRRRLTPDMWLPERTELKKATKGIPPGIYPMTQRTNYGNVTIKMQKSVDPCKEAARLRALEEGKKGLFRSPAPGIRYEAEYEGLVRSAQQNRRKETARLREVMETWCTDVDLSGCALPKKRRR